MAAKRREGNTIPIPIPIPTNRYQKLLFHFFILYFTVEVLIRLAQKSNFLFCRNPSKIRQIRKLKLEGLIKQYRIFKIHQKSVNSVKSNDWIPACAGMTAKQNPTFSRLFWKVKIRCIEKTTIEFSKPDFFPTFWKVKSRM